MRWLMWSTIGVTIACALGAYIGFGFWLWIAGGLFLAGGIAVFLLKKKYEKLSVMKIPAVVFIGIAVGMFWTEAYNLIHLQPVRIYDAQTIPLCVEISDYSYRSSYRTVADGTVTLDGRSYAVRGYFEDIETLSPGDRVTGEFYLRLTLASEDRDATFHQADGIFLLAYAQEGCVVQTSASVPSRYKIAEFRKGILDILSRVFPEDTAGFARALLLGDSSLLTYEEDTAYKVSGIRHVIAVSGLHVSILFSLVYVFSGKRRYLTAILGIPALLLFAALAGFTPSIVRACVMQGLMILALLLNREYDTQTALAFSVLVILTVNPLTITSVGFQLSAGCTVGILLLCGILNDYLLRVFRYPGDRGLRSRITKWFCGSVSVTLSAMAITTPLSAIYFGTVSISGILTNLIALWGVSFVFYGIMLACALGAFWTAGGAAVAWLISWLIRYISGVAKLIAAFPYSAVYTCSIYVVAWLILCYALIILFVVLPDKYPGLLAGFMATGLVLSIFASYITPRLDHFRLTILDVGQGQSVLWSSGGRNYLVDCGGDDPQSAADTASQLLLSQGISKLDGIILTHYDSDHAAGVEYLLTRIDTDAIFLPDIADDAGIREKLLQNYGDISVLVSDITELSTSQMRITLYPGGNANQENESSMCVLFTTEKCDILVTGDRGIPGERELLQQADIPQLDLLVVGHHGSSSSTGLELLNATRPAAAAISVGEKNRYGHPTDAVLSRLEFFGCVVWRTDLDGTIIFRG